MTFADVIDLGYDPTLIRIRDEDDKIQYVFNVGGKSYRTIRSLDDSSARDVVTRATRVWAARECDPITKQFLSEHEVALKDFLAIYWSSRRKGYTGRDILCASSFG